MLFTDFLSIFFILLMVIGSNEIFFTHSMEISNTKVALNQNARVRRFTVPLTGWQYQSNLPRFYGLPYVRTPWDYLLNNRRNDFLTVMWPNHLYEYSGYPSRVIPLWQASSKLMGGEDITGIITFQQIPYSNQIKVMLNATGLPPGKHALHIHTYGDVSDNCQLTGGQFPNTFLGNVEAKEDGSISIAFINMFLNLFGYNGIIGRSVVIHENPIDLNMALNADIYSTPAAFNNEERAVGKSLACGIISITNVQQHQTELQQPQQDVEQAAPADEK